jgi:hypothetical protein
VAQRVKPDSGQPKPRLEDAFVQGSDTAGYRVNPDTGMTSLLGVPIRTTTSMTSKSAVVGEFSSA